MSVHQYLPWISGPLTPPLYLHGLWRLSLALPSATLMCKNCTKPAKQARKSLFKIIALARQTIVIGARELELKSTETKRRRIFKCQCELLEKY